jgi:AraC-like DNA-binding protein
LISNLFLTDIGFFPQASNHFRERPRGCNEYILIYCIQGQGHITIGDQTHLLLPSTYILIEKGQPHTYCANNRDPWSIYWVHFSGDNAPYLYERFAIQHGGHPIFLSFNQSTIDEFDYIIDLFKLGYTDQVFEYSNLLLHKLIGSFIYYSLEPNNIRDRAKEDLVKSIKEYLNNNIHRSLHLKEIQQVFNRSSSSLCAIFKEKTGYSVMHFFGLLKIQKACELMNLTTLSIKEISFKLDYQDPLYFSRVFRKFMGVSPRAYRESTGGSQ